MRCCILTGEGARGAWQAAAIKKLDEDFDLLIGVSSGALNAVGWSILELDVTKPWAEVSKLSQVFSFNPWFWKQQGFFTAKPHLDRVNRFLTGFKARTKVMFPVMNANTSGIVWNIIWPGDLTTEWERSMVAAAAAIPGMITPVNGFVDAGMRLLCPIGEAVKMGATEITVITGSDPNIAPVLPKTNAISCTATSAMIALYEIMKRDIDENIGKVPIRFIFPPNDLPGWQLGFSSIHEMLNVEKYPMQIIQPDVMRTFWDMRGGAAK